VRRCALRRNAYGVPGFARCPRIWDFDRQDLAEAESARLAKIGLKTTVGQAVVDGKLKFLLQAGRYDTHAAAGNAGQVRAAAANAHLRPTR
jgi:hypothetical protein